MPNETASLIGSSAAMILQGSPLSGTFDRSQSNINTSSQGWNRTVLNELNEEMFARLAVAIAVLLALMLVGVVGNVAICYVFICRLRLNTQNLLLLSLGVFDLLSSCVGVPAEIYDMRHYYLYDSKEACKAMRFLTTLPSLASILILLVIAGDRYRKICHPLRLQLELRHVRFALFSIVIVALVFSIPAIYIYGHRSFPTPIPGVFGHDCSVDDAYKGKSLPIIYESIFGAAFVLLTMVLVSLYVRIWLETRRHRKYMATHATVGTPNALNDIAVSFNKIDSLEKHDSGSDCYDTSFGKETTNATPPQTRNKRRLRFHLHHHENIQNKQNLESLENLTNGSCRVKSCTYLKKNQNQCSKEDLDSLEQLNGDSQSEFKSSVRLTDMKSKESFPTQVETDELEKVHCDSDVESALITHHSESSKGFPVDDPATTADSAVKFSLEPVGTPEYMKGEARKPFLERKNTQSFDENLTPSSVTSSNGGIERHRRIKALQPKIFTFDSISDSIEDMFNNGKYVTEKIKKLPFLERPIRRCKSSQSITSARVRKALKATRTTIIACVITTGFILSYLPHLTLIILRSVITDFEHHFDDVTLNIYNILIRSYFVNNVINIFVYGSMNSEFRSQLWKIGRKVKTPFISERSDTDC